MHAELSVLMDGSEITMSIGDVVLPGFISSLHSVQGLVDCIYLNDMLPEDNELRAVEESLKLADEIDRKWGENSVLRR